MVTRGSQGHTTAFIGRHLELIELSALLNDPACRVVTLTGLGGIGKTRLALELAAQTRESFRDGVYVVSLQPLQSSEQIVTALISVLEVEAAHNPYPHLLKWLSHKQLLLVLDNFEHLIDGAGILGEMLEAAPNIKLLVTSRDALRLRAEWRYLLSGLDYPPVDHTGSVSGFGAVQLFVACARRQDSQRSIEAQLPYIAQICQLVEGMPLALELAASWLKSMTCAEIVAELREGIAVLESRAIDMPDRHRSMAAVFDRAWYALTDEERVVLQGCTVFHGGFTREAVEAVAGAALPVLTGLIERSLLRHDPTNGRFDLHPLLRQHLSALLDRSPETRDDLLDRHCLHYTEYLHQHTPTVHLGNRYTLLAELDNLRVAWGRAARQRNLTALKRAVPGLYWLYHFQAWFEEGAAMFFVAEDAISQLPVTDESRFVQGTLHLLRSYLTLRQETPSKLPPTSVQAALELWDGLDQVPEMGLPLSRAAFVLEYQRSDPAQVIAIAWKCYDLHREYNELAGVAISLTTVATTMYRAYGEFAEARRLLARALTIDQQIGFALNAGWSEGVLSEIAFLQGRYEETRAHAEAWVAYRRAVDSAFDVALHALGRSALELGDDVTARVYFERCVQVAIEQQQFLGAMHGHAGLGLVAAFQDDIDQAHQRFAECQVLLQKAGYTLSSYDHESESLGQLVLVLGYFERAVTLLQAEVLAHGQTGYQIPLMVAQSRLGHALVGLSDAPGAAPYLFDALGSATAVGALQVALEALMGIAQLPHVPPVIAVELLCLVCENRASNRYSRTRAQSLLTATDWPLAQDEFKTAMARGQALTPKAAAALVEAFHPDVQTTPSTPDDLLIDPISPRELEVLVLMAHGYTNQEIAERLFVGVSTIKKHINHIFSKLGVTHRAKAVARARSLRILA